VTRDGIQKGELRDPRQGKQAPSSLPNSGATSSKHVGVTFPSSSMAPIDFSEEDII
jgi:hypothetical protein